MKIRELIEKLEEMNGDWDIMLNVDKRDVKTINDLANSEPAFLLLDVDVSDVVFGDIVMITIKE